MLRRVAPELLVRTLFVFAVLALATVAPAVSPCAWAQAPEAVRIASYNIQFLSASIPTARRDSLRQVISRLDADVIGLEEIADRPALTNIFPTQNWHVIIDDDSGDDQDVAVVVNKKRFDVVGFNADLDADDTNFLFPSASDNSPFPNRRDVLVVEVRPKQPAGSANVESFFVLVVHAKSRVGGRKVTDPRRELAAQMLVNKLKQSFADRNFFLLGDFNDNPDDRSSNILETGDANAVGGAEELDGPFLINLMESLVAQDRVSEGRTANDIVGDKVSTVDPGSRKRNNDARGTNDNTGDILFDQILIPAWMKSRYVAGSAAVFDDKVAMQGSSTDRASDHLPVYAEFVLEPEGDGDTPSSGVRIASALPNPTGTDSGKEEVTIHNLTSSAVTLTGWKFRDRSGNEFALSGSIAAGASLTIKLPSGKLPLNNDGDDIILLNDQGQEQHRVSYTGAQAQSGQVVAFP
jgi:endonuclease/exonuclease/phosphatase family metal-dependent hydrolase